MHAGSGIPPTDTVCTSECRLVLAGGTQQHFGELLTLRRPLVRSCTHVETYTRAMLLTPRVCQVQSGMHVRQASSLSCMCISLPCASGVPTASMSTRMLVEDRPPSGDDSPSFKTSDGVPYSV